MALIAALLLAQSVAASPLPTPAVPAGVRLEATSTSSFTIQSPRLDMHGATTRVEGIVCRRPLHLGQSPEKVQIERVQTDGTITATIFAFLPPLPRRFDQSCVRFGIPLKPPPVSGELIRICLARKGGCAAA